MAARSGADPTLYDADTIEPSDKVFTDHKAPHRERAELCGADAAGAGVEGCAALGHHPRSWAGALQRARVAPLAVLKRL